MTKPFVCPPKTRRQLCGQADATDNVLTFPVAPAARVFAQDRAAAVVVAVLTIVRRALRAWASHGDVAGLADEMRTEIETLLRGEFADIARSTISEIRPSEDG